MAAAGSEEAKPEIDRSQLTELERLQLNINEKSDDTLECTRRMREMCAEAKVNIIFFILFRS